MRLIPWQLRKLGVYLAGAMGVLHLGGCSARPGPAAVPGARPATALPGQELIDEATRHFYAGKSLALAGDFDCARREFQQAVDAVRPPDGPAPESPGILEFSIMLYESIRRCDALAEPIEEPGEETKKAEGLAGVDVAAATPEEIRRAREAVASAGAQIEYDLPLVVNDAVLAMIANFSDRIPDRFAAGLSRAGRYTGMIRSIFEREGLPRDLLYVALVESAFKTSAYSPRRARGIWQFVVGTGRRYGLAFNRVIDERSDPYKATESAARYLKDLYELFGDWYLAIAAYNAGEGRVLRAMNRSGANSYWDLCRLETLPRETRNYVPAVLAAMIIGKNPSHYGFAVSPEEPPLFETVSVRRPADLRQLASRGSLDLASLRELNPELRTFVTPASSEGYALRVPPKSAEAVTAVLTQLPTARLPKEVRYLVRKDDTLRRIARRFRVSVAALAEVNNLSVRASLRPRSLLVVPERGAAAARPTKAAQGRTAAGKRRFVIPSEGVAAEPSTPARAGRYRVRKGDTLFAIASRHRSTVEQLREWNGLGTGDAIYPGDRLVVRKSGP